jgi:hypothetical protein
MWGNSFLSKPTFQICGCFCSPHSSVCICFGTITALLKNDSIITQTSDRYINSDNMMMFKGKKEGGRIHINM